MKRQAPGPTFLFLAGLSVACLVALPIRPAGTQTIRGAPEPAAESPTTELKKLVAGDAAADDQFGYSVAVSGDIVVAGSPFDDDAGADSGSAYLFARDQGGTDNWGQVKKLTASDGAAGAQFGWSVAIDGNTVVIGAPQATGAASQSGAAYVFERDQGGANNWGEVTRLAAADAEQNDRLGYAVAIDADTIVVDAFGGTAPGASGGGSVYVFERDQGGAGNWGELRELTATGFGGLSYSLGASLAIFGDTVVAGAPSDSHVGWFSGSAYVYERDDGGSDNWGEVKTRMVASATQEGHGFGRAVAISADTMAIGAQGTLGMVHLFERDLGGTDNWGEAKTLPLPLHSGGRAEFGAAVAISGSTLAVSNPYRGSTYVFEQDRGGADNWGLLDVLTPSDWASGDDAGRSVSISADTVVMGAPGDDDAGDSSGSAYVLMVSTPPPVAGYQVLDAFGGVHTGGSVPVLSPATPYFGFDVARDVELTIGGYYVLDGYGGVHAGGAAPVLLPPSPYFGFDIARDVELAANGYYVMEGFGGVHPGGGAPVLPPPMPYVGTDLAVDVEFAASGGYYLLLRNGDVYAGAGAPGSYIPLTPPLTGPRMARDLELGTIGFYVLDNYGMVHTGGGAPAMVPQSPYFGFNAAQDLELVDFGYYVLDELGGVHTGGAALTVSPSTPYFGFAAAEDLEIR